MSADADDPVWDRFFERSPLIVFGTRKEDAPAHGRHAEVRDTRVFPFHVGWSH